MKDIIKPGNLGQKHRTQLIGQAGVWAAAAQLAIQGHNVLIPGVDYGYDIQLENGLRIQVKAGGLRYSHPAYRDGAYTFDFRCFRWNSSEKRVRGSRDYSKVADFFVLWGIDENRFWVVPVGDAKNAIWFRRTPPNPSGRSYSEAKTRYESYENRWDLLDVNSTNQLIESASETVVPKEIA